MSSPPSLLEKQILATIVYYDILDYPLTAFEVFLYLIKNKKLEIGNWILDENLSESQRNKKELSSEASELSSFLFLLESSEYLKEYIDQKLGFYFLKGREETVRQRLDRKKLADQKWKKIKKIFWIMQIVPFQKMVLVSGSLALGNSRKDSDIDVIIAAKKGKIWIVRTFVTLLFSLLGTRRHGSITKDKICLNHYITDKSLKIPFESLYNAQSYIHLVSVYDSEEDKKLFGEFQKENKWIKKYAQNYEFSELGSFRSIKKNKILGFVSGFFEFVLSGKRGDYMENKLSRIQSNRIKKDPLCGKRGGRITISDDQLEFHPDSHESFVIPEFNRRTEKLELFEFAKQRDSGLVK